MKILIIDDEPEFRHILSEWLRRRGHDIHASEDGLNIRQLIPENQYDVVLLDLIMPKSNGLTLISRIRQLCSRTQVIVISAAADVHLAVEAVKEGAQACFLKPFDFDELEVELSRLAVSLQSETYEKIGAVAS
jgi:DNA-binding NtrC family response regulator